MGGVTYVKSDTVLQQDPTKHKTCVKMGKPVVKKEAAEEPKLSNKDKMKRLLAGSGFQCLETKESREVNFQKNKEQNKETQNLKKE